MESNDKVLTTLLQNTLQGPPLSSEQIKPESFYILHYRNSAGITTRRVIRVNELSPYYKLSTYYKSQSDNYHFQKSRASQHPSSTTRTSKPKHIYIKAYCYRARENRTFRLDRVISLHEADSIIAMGYSPLEIQHEITAPGEKTPQEELRPNTPSNTALNTIPNTLPNTETTHHDPPKSWRTGNILLALGKAFLLVTTFLMRTYYIFVIVIIIISALITGNLDSTDNNHDRNRKDFERNISRISRMRTTSVKKSSPQKLPQVSFVRLLPLPRGLPLGDLYNQTQKLLEELNDINKSTFVAVDLSTLVYNTPEARARFVKRFSYRGVPIELWENKYGKKYFAPSLGLDGISLHSLKRKINDALFQRRTGIVSTTLCNIYARADLNGDLHLSLREIKTFQKMLNKRYRYISNRRALRPDEFIKQGGGDCEDWALMTAGLLSYWGYSAYIGALMNKQYSKGHAVCLLYSSQKPPKGVQYLKITKNDPLRMYNSEIKPGYYIPIDYTVVGGYSNAILSRKKGKWYYGAIYVPERIYGIVM